MRRIMALWALFLLPDGAVSVDADIDFHKINTRTPTQEKRVEKFIPDIHGIHVDSVAVPSVKSNGFAYGHFAVEKDQDQAGRKSQSQSAENSTAGNFSNTFEQKGAYQGAGDDRKTNKRLYTRSNEPGHSIYRNQSMPTEQSKSNAQPSSATSLQIQNKTSTIVDASNQTTSTNAAKVLPFVEGDSTAMAAAASGADISIKFQSSTVTTSNPKHPVQGKLTAAVTVEAGKSEIANNAPIPMTTKISSSLSGTPVVVEAGPETVVDVRTGANITFVLVLSTTSESATTTTTTTTTMTAASASEASIIGESSAGSKESSSAMLHTLTSTTTMTHTAALDATDTNAANSDSAVPTTAMASGFKFPSASQSTRTSICTSTSTNTNPQAPLLSTTNPSFQAATSTTLVAKPKASTPSSIANDLSAAERAAQNGGCQCLCACPTDSFPMAAAPSFQLDPLIGMSIMQTIASASTPATAVVTTIRLPPTPGTTSDSPPSLTVPVPTPSPIPPSSPVSETPSTALSSSAQDSASSSPSASASSPDSAPTSVPLQSQAAANAPPAALPIQGIAPMAGQQGNGIPFDISTIALFSKVTVHLRRGEAKTEATGA